MKPRVKKNMVKSKHRQKNAKELVAATKLIINNCLCLDLSLYMISVFQGAYRVQH